MVDIDELNHATLLQNLEARYNRDEIYTYVGPIILAVNPFMNLNDKLYTDPQMDMYKTIIKSKTPYDDKKINASSHLDNHISGLPSDDRVKD
jgi:myosin V